MERVKKREKYWRVSFYPWGIIATDEIDNDDVYDRQFFADGNYFHTKEEAEAVAEKIRKVLKGADVIEMPNKREIEINTEQYVLSIPNIGGYERTLLNKAYTAACKWLESKIVK